MKVSGLTSGQRRVVGLLILAFIGVFATLAGFIVTSIRNWQNPAPLSAPSLEPSPSTPIFITPMPSASASPSTPDGGIQSQIQAARLLDQIAHQVETLRELPPLARVPLAPMDAEEMTALLRQIYVGRAPQEQLFPYMLLGLVPEAPIEVDVHPSAGVYVPEQEQLYVALGRPESGVDDLALLAHAYAHALQDQHFDLQETRARATTTDAALAVEALVEGDITLLTALYRYEDLVSAEWEYLAGLILQAEQLDYGKDLGQSDAWARLQWFPYREGRQFAEALFQAGGWEAVNRAYAALPRSTEQVLHPDRYLDGPGRPTDVIVPDVGDVLGDGWSVVLEDTLGELVIGLYLQETLPGATAWRAADGWDGDTFVVWQRGGGTRVRIWRTVWSETSEAAEFERALVALVPQRYLPAWPFEPPRGSAGSWWETGSSAVYVARAGRHVILVDAPDTDTLAHLAEVLP